MNSRIVFLITVCFQLLSIPTTVAQNGFIYGKVILKNGQTFQGQLRWKNREAMWHHIFDGDKSDRPYQNLLSTEESQKLQSAGEDFKFGFMALWEDRNPDQNFVFRCQFGNLVKLVDLDQGRVALYLKNGQRIYLVDDQDDLDTQIVIVDKNIGTQEFGFSAVQEIQFKSAPRDLDNAFGEPVYGKIMTSNGTFEGYITWDDEECLGDDVINGKNKGQSLAIRFRDISQIKAERDGAMVTLRNGKELFLNDHDDVDRGNHGITIHGLAFGTLEVNWENFISAEFTRPKTRATDYSSFGDPSLLSATVRTTSGAKITSQIVYDLDEIYDIEILNGENGGFQYFIPFSRVASIEPQNDKFSAVTVKSGEQFLLGGNGDVNRANNGLILKSPGNTARFLKWDQVKSIQFD